MSNTSFEYLWMDGQKKTSKVPAPQYIDFVMTWIQTLINDENTFPTKDGTVMENSTAHPLFCCSPHSDG